MSALPQRISVAGATFISGLWVPADKREEFFVTISNEPTVAITGATLEKNSIFGSPVATMAAETVGRFLRESALKDHMMCSASMRVYPDSTSFDADLTKPWQEAGGRVAQFTGSNIQMLHGAAWDIEHGTSYIIEEDIGDFSNHTKEAALFAGLKHPTSAFILGNGGPTVNINLTRAMALCPAGHVFSLAGCCSAEGQFRGSSAAIGSIPMKKESQEDALLSLGKFAPHFFTWLPSVEVRAPWARATPCAISRHRASHATLPHPRVPVTGTRQETRRARADDLRACQERCRGGRRSDGMEARGRQRKPDQDHRLRQRCE